MASGQTHYTPAAGTAEVRKAIAEWYGKTHGLSVGPENVIVSNGAKHSIHTALAACVGPGDEVVIPTPYWVSYSDLVGMTGATKPVLVEHDAREPGSRCPRPNSRPRSRRRRAMLMLNSPVQPDRHGLHAGRTRAASWTPRACWKQQA